jgi:hypothetical protein
MQNASVFVNSRPQLKPPQKITPPMPPTINNVASEKRELGRVRNTQMRAMRLFVGSGLPGALIAIPEDSSDQQVQPIGGLKCSHPIADQPGKCVD